MSVFKRLTIALAVFFTAGLLYSAPAAAQATRTWVSGVGDDANPCSRTAPCKTFAGAISKTAAGGEIDCLDPAGFGTVTIVKSMTIDCTGTLGSILSSSTTGVIVNAAATDNIILRGMTINGAPPSSPGVNGVRVLQAGSVQIENVKIFGFGGAAPNGNGVLINPSTGTINVTIVNSTISNNAAAGVSLAPAGAATVNLSISNSSLINNAVQGVNVNTTGGAGTLSVTVANTLVSGGNIAGTSGIIFKIPTGTATGSITGSTVVGNGAFGIRIGGGTVVVGTTTITGNGTGVNVGGGTLTSFGNNLLFGNGTNGSFSGTTPTS